MKGTLNRSISILQLCDLEKLSSMCYYTKTLTVSTGDNGPSIVHECAASLNQVLLNVSTLFCISLHSAQEMLNLTGTGSLVLGPIASNMILGYGHVASFS